MNLTAGYNADIARVYGINEALLLDAITFWERHSRRKDGYCWFTAEEFEVKTAIKPSAMKRAIDKLTAAGIIEVKNTYIIGTQIKCRHFKMIQTPKSEVSKVEQSDYAETAQSGSTETVQSVNSSDRTLTELYLPKGKCETPKTDEWKSRLNPDINELFEYWSETIGIPIRSKVQRNRNSCSTLIKQHGLDGVKKLIQGVRLAMDDQYAPNISDFISLQSKQNELIMWGHKKEKRNAIPIF
jgi:hypothetical protein